MSTLCSNNVFEKTSQQLHKTAEISEAKDKPSQASTLLTKWDFPNTSETSVIKTWFQETARGFEKAS